MKNLLTILFSLIAVSLYSQTAEMYLISSAGGDFTTQNEQLTFTIGEVITETGTANNLYVTQGFLQSESTVVSVEDIIDEDLSINIYPNPAETFFYIDIASPNEIDNSYNLSILDINGRVIYKQNIYQNKEAINISNYLSGSYFIKINNNKGESIKVILLHKL